MIQPVICPVISEDNPPHRTICLSNMYVCEEFVLISIFIFYVYISVKSQTRNC